MQHIIRRTHTAALLLLCALTIAAQTTRTTLRIIVSDFESHLPIATAEARVGKAVFGAKTTGEIVIPTNALTTDTLRVSAKGYLPQSLPTAEVYYHQPLRLQLTRLTNALSEAVVSGTRPLHTQNVSAHTLTATELRSNLGNSFASTLEQIKGMSMVQTGATIAKPVLHGMYGNRLLIMNNGVRQVGQQWGADHAPELDVNAAGRISVVKGAEAVRYGSEALGGVVLIDSKSLPIGRQRTEGNVSALYGTNGRRMAFTAEVDKGFSLWKGNAAWRLQATYVNGGDRTTAHYLLNNTGLRELNASAAFGWQRKQWWLDAYYSLFTTQLGVLYSAQMGEKDLLLERIAIGQPTETKPWSRSIDYPHQKVRHHVARLAARYQFNAHNRLQLQAAYQYDDRREFNLRRNYRSHVPTLDLNLATFQFDANWKNSYAQHWSTEVGSFCHTVDNHNIDGTGVVPIIPNYTQRNLGIFGVQKYSGENWGAEAGLRFDHQDLHAIGRNMYGDLYGGKTHYNNLTYTFGTHLHLTPQLDLLTNVGTAWRAPHVHELYSNGLELGSGLYAIGDSTLRPEVSTKWVVTARYHTPRIALSLDLYTQWINHYIYDTPTQEIRSMVSGFYPVFRYRSTNANFRGFDAEAKWNISRAFTYEMGGAMIWANERGTGRYLPYIPPLRLSHALRFNMGSFGHLHEVYVKAQHKFSAKQNRFDAASDLISFTPPAYHLFGVEMGGAWVLRNGQRISILLTADNLFNRAYKEYTNRFRYYAHDLGRDVRMMLTWTF